MKFRDLDGQFKDIVIKTGDTLPVGSVVEYEGSTPPAGWSKLSDGGSVIVSSEEPTTGEEVWFDDVNKTIHTKNGDIYEEFYNEEVINQIQESMKYLNGYIYSFKTIYYSANTDTDNDANKFVSGLHIIDNNVTISNRPSKVNNTLEAVLVFTGNPNGSGDNGVQIWFNGADVIYVRLKTWGSYTGWRRISVT